MTQSSTNVKTVKQFVYINNPIQFYKGNYDCCFSVFGCKIGVEDWIFLGEIEIPIDVDDQKVVDVAMVSIEKERKEELVRHLGKMESLNQKVEEMTALPAPKIEEESSEVKSLDIDLHWNKGDVLYFESGEEAFMRAEELKREIIAPIRFEVYQVDDKYCILIINNETNLVIDRYREPSSLNQEKKESLDWNNGCIAFFESYEEAQKTIRSLERKYDLTFNMFLSSNNGEVKKYIIEIYREDEFIDYYRE